MDYNYQIKTLTEWYSAIMENGKSPEWAVKKTDSNEYVSCTIPFVGKNYFSQKKKVLVYASAENLSKYDGYLDNDKVAINRHRCFFDTSVESTDFFPSVHMRPFYDGALATAVLYILTKYLEINDDVQPAELYENIAFGNYGKFSISGKKNIDYASSKGYLAYSHDLIKADIDILKPDIIILPSAILKADENFIKTIRGNADLIPLYQINSGNINRIISKKYGTSKIDIDDLPLCVKNWYKNLCKNGFNGKTWENYLYVFPYIDDVLEKERVNNLLEKLISTVVSAIAQLGCETNRVNWSIYSNFNIIMPDKTTKTAKITHIDSIGKLMFKVYPVNCVVCDFKKDDDIEFAAEKIVECIFETEPNVFKNYSKEH